MALRKLVESDPVYRCALCGEVIGRGLDVALKAREEYEATGLKSGGTAHRGCLPPSQLTNLDLWRIAGEAAMDPRTITRRLRGGSQASTTRASIDATLNRLGFVTLLQAAQDAERTL